MRLHTFLFAVVLALCLTAPEAFLLHSARADDNPAPVNVGMSAYTVVSAAVTPALAIARNAKRAGLIIQNNGSVSVVIKPGSNPSSATDGIVLIAGQLWEPVHTPVDALYIESASSTASVIFIEEAK